VLCAPFVYLPVVADLLAGCGIQLGAQNVSEFGSGAYTGEISAPMLVDVGCSYVIVGHSERRQLLGEGDAQVMGKLIQAFGVGLRPILCVGETLVQRAAGEARAVLMAQLDAVSDCLRRAEVGSYVIAYEPIWAIGSGQAASDREVQEAHRWIRDWLCSATGDGAKEVPLLYGGSVTPANATNLFACPDVDGVLVGGASLRGEDFLLLCQAAAFGSSVK
jgi:triosephosphate isomerase